MNIVDLIKRFFPNERELSQNTSYSDLVVKVKKSKGRPENDFILLVSQTKSKTKAREIVAGTFRNRLFEELGKIQNLPESVGIESPFNQEIDTISLK